ncbi:type III secretion system inner membrane ring lipoprotein SctJ [Stenotrophomonas sp. NPDC077659]|uniref:type III secretion system inner membrane ring lipoprotein SctJ n=1 Tax=Stenotrophomonas sp. NPDC077659 TaxID=3390694 RepID=UPI003D08C58E
MMLFRLPRAALLALLCLLLVACARTPLLQGLDERQANEVVAMLLRHNISADKRLNGKAGFSVEVGQGDLAQAIDLVQAQNLPSAPRTQIASQFPADAMVSTPLGERARLLSAIEQRLEESLTTLDGVHAARVHVSYDAGPVEGSLQQRKPPAMHVAALLVHVPGADQQALLQSVKRFLRNAFVDVAYDNVSVVLTPAQSTRVLAVTPVERYAGPWLSLLLPVSLVVLLGGAAWLFTRSGQTLSSALAALRGRLRRGRSADVHAR